MQLSFARACAACFITAAFLLRATGGAAEEKFVQLEPMQARQGISVNADGSRITLTGNDYLVFNEHGQQLKTLGIFHWGTGIIKRVPLADGRFISCTRGLSPSVDMMRADGSKQSTLVSGGGGDKALHGDVNWSSPHDMAVDVKAERIFVAEETHPDNSGGGTVPDPQWVRVGMWDFSGKYLGDIYRYDAKSPDAASQDSKRMDIAQIAVDPERQRIYLAMSDSQHHNGANLLAMDYSGKLLGQTSLVGFAWDNGDIDVLKNGDVISSWGGDKEIHVYSPDLKPLPPIGFPRDAMMKDGGPRVRQFAIDGAGRLYASVGAPQIIFIRWSENLRDAKVFSIKHLLVVADIPGSTEAGKSFTIPVEASGEPKPDGTEWTVMARPSDGRSLAWQQLPASFDGKLLHVTAPAEFSGFYDTVVRYGKGEIVNSNRDNDPFVQKRILFIPKGSTASVAVITDTGRRAFRQGEAVAVQIICRSAKPHATTVKLRLLDERGSEVKSATVPVDRAAALELPAAFTQRLVPGAYTLAPQADGYASYPLAIDIAAGYADSPMQRILYHEYGFSGILGANYYHDIPERMNFVRSYVKAAHNWGFTRETDRLAEAKKGQLNAWRRDGLGDLSNPSLAPAEYYDVLPQGDSTESDYYLDRAVAAGLVLDSHLSHHCEALRFRDYWLKRYDTDLQRFVQWAGRYPSHYGLNYHDEDFWGDWDSSWTPQDKNWLADAAKRLGSKNAAWIAALRTMYDSYNTAVHAANPSSKVTCTPMWQGGLDSGTYAPQNFKHMDESFTHYLTEGVQQPWYVLHSLESFRRPGLPLMGVVDDAHNGSGGEIVMKNEMLSLCRGVQGVGISFTAPLDAPTSNNDALGADVYRSINRLAKWYGPIFAETTPVNEAAVLYSVTQAGAEKGRSWEARHWGSVYGALGGLMMAGVPANMVYEEDVGAGWLLADGKPRYPMLFLVDQKAALPAAVQQAINAFAAAGGKIFVDADSADYPRAVKLSFPIFIPAAEGFANDACFVTMSPKFEALAAKLKDAVAQYRNFPLDTDDAWVERGLFDGGDVWYVMLAAETRPFPWYGAMAYDFSSTYTRTVQPRTVELSYPASPGVVYDVFDHQIVRPDREGSKQHLSVNLRQFSGRLYAKAPEPLAAPAVTATLRGDRLAIAVQAVGESGRALSAQVPLRIRVRNAAMNSKTTAVEEYRGTSRAGNFQEEILLPPGNWNLEVTEMLGGHAATGTLTVGDPLPELTAPRPDVETFRQPQLEGMLAAAKTSGISLILPAKKLLTEEQVTALSKALKARGIALFTDKPLPSEPTPGILLTAACSGNGMGVLLENARNGGLAPLLISSNVPGPGRGFITPLYAPRGYGENAIALVAGDPAGLAKTVNSFCKQLAQTGTSPTPAASKSTPASVAIACKPLSNAVPLTKLSEMVGPKLNRIAVSQNSPYLAVSAAGFGKNLALIKDLGNAGQVVSAARVGASPTSDSLFVSPDGRFAGLSARELARCGEAFHLLDAGKQSQTLFAAFGDLAARYHHFAASSDGNYVMAVGTYGVICWKREQNGWKEAWANEYWKSFDKLSWPISDTDERIPTFHAYIPQGADYALVVFSETGDNGWVTPDHHYKALLAAYSLADGRQRWRFEIPIPDAQLFPTLFASPDGRNLLVKVQNGSWTAVSYAFYSLDGATGALRGKPWTNPASPKVIAVGNGDGSIAEVFSGRQLELRMQDGRMLFDQLWNGADPVSMAFSSDGKRLYVADDADRLSCVGPDGAVRWQVTAGAVSQLAVSGERIYAAGWDGRVRAFSADGTLCWKLDCTAAMDELNPLAAIMTASRYSPDSVVAAKRPSSASPTVPPGSDLVSAGLVNLRGEKVEGDALRPLQTGKKETQAKPLVTVQQLLQDMLAGQQAQFILEFPRPTDVGTLTVRENLEHPEAYPTDSFIGVWNEKNKQWETVKRGVFLDGPLNTYALNLKGVTKLIYCPWNNYGHNFYTTKIEVRLLNSKDGYQQNFDSLADGPVAGQDFWKGGDLDTVVPNPSGGKMLRIHKGAERPVAFMREPGFRKQVASFDFMFPRTINDPAFAVTQGVKQLGQGFTVCGPDPDQTFRFGYEGARNSHEAWIDSLRVGNTSGPNTIAPNVWYHAEIALDRAAGSFDFQVTETASGKLYWHPAPQPCGKLNVTERGQNLIQFSAQQNDDPDKGGFCIDNVKVTVVKSEPAQTPGAVAPPSDRAKLNARGSARGAL